MRIGNDPDRPGGGGARLFVVVDEALAGELSDVRVQVELFRDHLEAFSALIRKLESQDKLSNFEIQEMLSDYNAAEGLASTVRKKVGDTIACMIGKL